MKRQTAQYLLHLLCVQHKFPVVICISIMKIYPFIEHCQRIDGRIDIPQRHPVDVGQAKHRLHRRPLSFARYDLQASSRSLCRLFEKRKPKPYSSGCPRSEKRIFRLPYLFFTHPASIIPDRHLQRILLCIRRDVDLYVIGTRTHGILRDIQNVQRDLCHHIHSYFLFIFGQNIVNVIHGQPSVYLVVDHHDRRKAASVYYRYPRNPSHNRPSQDRQICGSVPSGLS